MKKKEGGEVISSLSNSTSAFTCSKLTIETLEHCVKYVQSQQ